MTDDKPTRLAFASHPHNHGWKFGDVLSVLSDYGSAVSVRNARTGETATVLTSQLEFIPADAVLRSEMMARVSDFTSGGIGLCNADWHMVGPALAALALFEAMSEVSEETMCAGWLLNNGDMCWSWLKTGEIRCADMVDHLKPTIIALANASQLWWADYHYAVPLKEWIVQHGETLGVRSS